MEQLATGLAWPEGPTVLPDGRVIFVETYRSQIGYWTPDGESGQFAYTAGGPNATALGSDGAVYVCQNGGVVGPWRAEERRPPSIQRITPDGTIEIVATAIEGVSFQAPNDLTFGADGRLYFTDPGRYDAEARPDPGYIFALDSEGRGEVWPGSSPCTRTASRRGRRHVVWVESYTRRVSARHRRRPHRAAGRARRGPRPDGLKVAANGDL